MDYPISVGLDVHKNSVSAYSYNILTEEKRERTFGSDTAPLIGWLQEHKDSYRVVYEAGYSGFSLKRALEASGIVCEIAATSKIERAKSDKVKTDKKDAAALAHLLAAGRLSFVFVPTIESEGLRDLNRAYVDARDAAAREKQHISKMLDRYDIRCALDVNVWSDSHLAWLNNVIFPSRGANMAFLHYLDELARLADEKKRLDLLIKQYCAEKPLQPTVDALRCLKGIAHNTAFCLITEVSDFTRFSPPSSFASYLGLVPSEYSSGERQNRGNITKSGNSLVRKQLVESSWSYYRSKRAYKHPVEGVPDELARMANKANKRLFYKAQALKDEKKKPCVCVVAIARELALWVAAIAWTCQTGSLELVEGCR